MIESTYSTLKYHRLSRTATQSRAATLQHTIDQLNQYHVKASKKKKPVINLLIVVYSDLLESIQKKLGE